MPTIQIDGLTPDDKDPGAYVQPRFAVGKVSVGQIPLKCTLVGNKTAAGTAAVSSLNPCTSPEDAATLCGITSELARQAYAAFDVEGVQVQLLVVAEASGGAAATATITIAGSWTTTGQATFQLDEQVFTVNFGLSESTPTLAAVATVTAINQQQGGKLFCTAGNSAGVVTATTANVGVRNNQHTLYLLDKSRAPAGMTIAIAGGTALSNGGVPFTGGTGTDDITAAITAYDAVQLDYIGAAHNDATNVGLLETHANTKMAADVGLYDQYVVSGNGTQAAAIAIAQTQMNDPLGQFVWVPLGVEHPSRIAARMAALRSVNEGAQPNTNYNKVVLPGAAPHIRDADSPGHAIRKAALNAGITPMRTINGKLVIVRSINSRCLTGSTPDYRTLDSGQTTVPLRITKELGVLYDATLEQNKYAGPDLTDGMPPEGRFTPRFWASIVDGSMQDFEAANWVTDTVNNPTQAIWDNVGKRVASATPTLVELLNNQVAAQVNQVPA